MTATDSDRQYDDCKYYLLVEGDIIRSTDEFHNGYEWRMIEPDDSVIGLAWEIEDRPVRRLMSLPINVNANAKWSLA